MSRTTVSQRSVVQFQADAPGDVALIVGGGVHVHFDHAHAEVVGVLRHPVRRHEDVRQGPRRVPSLTDAPTFSSDRLHEVSAQHTTPP